MRTAVYSSIGPEAVYLTPPRSVPGARSAALARNEFRFVPGSIVWPQYVVPADPFTMQAEQWGSNSALFCAPDARVLRLSDLGPSKPIPDIVIDYSFAFSLQDWLVSLMQLRPDRALQLASDPGTLRQQAALDLRLRDNDLRFVRSISIRITNIEVYQADEAQLRRARASIARSCRLPGLGHYRQVARIYAGDIEFSVAVDDGARVNARIIAARLARQFKLTQSGKAMFFALKTGI
jgi:hypothetical protein